MLIMRAAFAWFCIFFKTPPLNASFKSEAPSEPNGLAHFIDLAALLNHDAAWTFMYWGSVVALLFYVAGFLMPVSTFFLLAVHVCVYTLDNSYGAIKHAQQLIGIVLLAQFLAYTIWPLALTFWKSKLSRKLKPTLGRNAHELAVHWTIAAVAAAYVVSGVTKLVESEGRWIIDTPNLAVQLEKTEKQNYYNDLQTEPAPLANWANNLLTNQPNLGRMVFGSALILELAAIIALFGRPYALMIGVALIALHLSISAAMGLSFPNHLKIIAIYLINPAWWIIAGRLLFLRVFQGANHSGYSATGSTSSTQ